MLCPICCDDFEKPSTIAHCNFCEYETCTKCAQQYLLGSIENAHCMNCRKGWTRERMLETFSKQFVNRDYKAHRENVLFEREKSLLPATQPHAERKMKEREMLQNVEASKVKLAEYKKDFYNRNPEVVEYTKQLDELLTRTAEVTPKQYNYYADQPIRYLELNLFTRHCDYPCMGRIMNGICRLCKYSVCNSCGQRHKYPPNSSKHVCKEEDVKMEQKRKVVIEEFKTLFNDPHARACKQKLRELDSYLNTVRQQMRKETRNVRILLNANENTNDASQTPTDSEKTGHNFVRACPVDGCRGFLSSAWKCGMCGIFACSKCHEVKGDKKDAPHTCKLENVETAKMLAKNTKGCPNCHVLIYKLGGCSQMWCVECHTAFDWNTGKIATGQIHNPHYYEYLRKNNTQPREIRDIPCGGVPDYLSLVRHVRNVASSTNDADAKLKEAYIERYHRGIGEVIDLRTWYRNRNLQDTREIRVKYLIKDYDESMFKKMLQIKAKAQEKVTNIDQVLDMFVMASSYILQRLLTIHTREEVELILAELEQLRGYMNDSMKRVSQTYDCKVPWIDENLHLHRVGERREEISA